MILKYEIMIMNAYYHGIIHVFLSSIESTIPNILNKIYLKISEYSSEIFKKPQIFELHLDKITFPSKIHKKIKYLQKIPTFKRNIFHQKLPPLRPLNLRIPSSISKLTHISVGPTVERSRGGVL